MKVGLLLGLSALAGIAATIIAGTGDPLSYPHLTQLNQSQTCETLSLADGLSRLPASVYKTAKVHFVVNSSDKMGFDYKEQEFNHDNINRCKALGFSKTGACAAGQYAVRFCPYDNAYFSQCCDNTYAYSKAECSYPRTISSNSCGGKFKCYCDATLYPHTSCPAPQEPADKCVDDTGTHYAECKCPANWISCDSSIHQKGSGTGCSYNGTTTYASCTCESGYTLTCEDYGPKNSADYCFLKGTKYYKTCKTAQEVCEGLGFGHNDGHPCSADEVIDGYCPRSGTYYSCKIDPVKYCKNHGYSNGGCGAYETVSSSACPYDASYKKCIPTCKSRLAADRYIEINEGLWYKGKTAVVLKDITNINLTNPLGVEYTDIKSEATLYKRDAYTECSSWNKPSLTIGANSGSRLLAKNLNDVTVILDHNGTAGLAETHLEAGGTWEDVTVTETNLSSFGDQPSDAYNDIHVMKKSSRLHVTGILTLKGNNVFRTGGQRWIINNDNNQKIGMFHLEINGDGKVHIESGNTRFQGIPIMLYENIPGAEFVISNATFYQEESGFRVQNGNGVLHLSNANATFYRIWINGTVGSQDNFNVTQASRLTITGNMRLYNSKLSIYGNSTVIQNWKDIGVCNKDRICIGSGSKLCSEGTTYCKSGGAVYTAEPGKGKCDWAAAGNSNWYKTDYMTVNNNCGWYYK